MPKPFFSKTFAQNENEHGYIGSKKALPLELAVSPVKAWLALPFTWYCDSNLSSSSSQQAQAQGQTHPWIQQ